MSNLPPHPYNNIPGVPTMTSNPEPPLSNHQFSIGQVPVSQLPPGYSGQIKKDQNFNTPTGPPMSNMTEVQNHINQTGNNSPAFNAPGMKQMMPPGTQASPSKPLIKPATPAINQNTTPSTSFRPASNVSTSFNSYPPPFQQQQINNNAPPMIPSSQYSQPSFNRPLGSLGPQIPSNYPPASNMFTPPSSVNPMSSSTSNYRELQVNANQVSKLPPAAPVNPKLVSQSGPVNNMSNASQSVPPRYSPLVSQPGSFVNQAPISILPPNGPPQITTSTQLPSTIPLATNGPINQYGSSTIQQRIGTPTGPFTVTAQSKLTTPLSGPPLPPQSGPLLPPQSGPLLPPQSGPLLPPKSVPVLPPQMPSQITPANLSQSGPSLPQNGPTRSINPPGPYSGAQGMPPPAGPQSLSNITSNDQMKSNMQNRYPPLPQTSYPQQMPPIPQPMMLQQNTAQQYSQQQYSSQGLSQQMGQLSVTKQGYDQLWGHHMIDLMQARHILPEYPEDPPEIKLGPPFTEAPNCSPEIFRCTVNRIPDTNSLLQKSRLPLGILIHPFKDLNYLPVIQCTTIVRCRACRTYINPFVYFIDAKRWKCNLCYRVNDLPEEFQYDPVSKSYGDPTRRPEIKSATIEFIAPGEYMLRPPQPAVYLFLMDVSHLARESGYLQVLCDTLKENLEQLPGDARTQVGFICYDVHVHFYLMSDGLTRPKEMTVLDIDDVFLPSPESLLVNLGERRELVRELLTTLPQRHSGAGVPASALGAALQAAYKIMAPTGGRVTVFQTCLPTVGPGALTSREDPNARSSKDVAHLNPATDFYKRLALDCSGAQIAVDLFLLNSQYSDLASLSGMSKFSAGTVYHLPLFKATRAWQADQLRRTLVRYLTRKIGFEAVMRVRATRGISIHTFHGNFFVRSTDLLSLPNVSPDAGFGMQLTIDESLADLNQVCFQAALLYTSSKGERRIRVHTLALPIANNLNDVLYAADQQCIIGLLVKMAVDRSQSASMSEAREALVHVAVEALGAHRLAQQLPAGPHAPALHAPRALALLPLMLLATTKAKAFRTGLSTRLDDRVAAMCNMKCLPLAELLRSVYPDLYPIHDLPATVHREHEDAVPDPPRMQLTAERLSLSGAYLLDDGETMIIYVCHGVSPAFLSEVFGVTAFNQIQDEARTLPSVNSEGNELLHTFVEKLNDDRPYASNILILRDNSPSKHLFIERLVEDRVESAFSYYEFLQHVKSQVK